MPQIDIYSYLYQIIILILFIFFFFFVLDKFLLYIYFNVYKIKLKINKNHLNWINHLKIYKNIIENNQFLLLYKYIIIFITNNIIYFNLILNWLFNIISKLLNTYSIKYYFFEIKCSLLNQKILIQNLL
jgi:hypothetical protein